MTRTTGLPAAHPDVPAVDQSDRTVPRNPRQSCATPVEMLIPARVRKSPFAAGRRAEKGDEPMQQFSNGDRVRWRDGETVRTGVVTASNAEAPPEAGSKAGGRFHRVTAADGTSYVVAEGDLDPTNSRPEG